MPFIQYICQAFNIFNFTKNTKIYFKISIVPIDVKRLAELLNYTLNYNDEPQFSY